MRAEGPTGFGASQVLPPGGEDELKKKSWAGRKAGLQASQPEAY